MNKSALKILEILEKHRGETVSGERIAEELGLTRSAVWKNINAIKKAGYQIRSTNNRGYELTRDNELFTANSILKEVDESKIGVKLKIEVLEEVDSTNVVVKEEARNGEKEGRVLVAKKQLAGKGRLGRSFFSPKNGIYLSILLRPKLNMRDALLLTTIAAVSVTDAIKEVTGKEVGIKWVNDVYLEDRKLCGILTEAEADLENGMLSYAVVGIGLNITEPEEGVPEELKEIAGFLYGKEDCSGEILSKLTASIISYYFSYYERLPERIFMESYRKNQILLGKEIFVISLEEKKRAKVLGVDEEARLLVEYENGEKVSLFTGEVSVREVGKEKKNNPMFAGVKKGMLFFFLFLYTLTFYGCSGKKETQSELRKVGSEREMETGYVFQTQNTEFSIGEEVEEKRNFFEAANSKYEAPSCADFGEDIIYTFSGFTITVNKKTAEEKGRIYSIILTDDSVKTAEGLHIGDGQEEVIRLYGEAPLEDNSYIYSKGEMELNIIIREEKVLSIEYRKKKNVGGGI